MKKDEIIDLYVNKHKTTYEIAELAGVHRSTIGKKLKKWGVHIINEQRKYYGIKRTPLTQEQHEMIIGTMLGDGCIAPHGRRNKSYRLIVGHCEKQKELVLWKKKILANLVNVVSKRDDIRGNSTMYTFNTVTHNGFRFYDKLFYDGRKKVIRPELENYIAPLSLAVWVMDDGSLNKKVNMRLATDGFSKEDNQTLQRILKLKFGVRSKICGYQRHNQEYNYLSMNKRNSLILSDIVKPYIIDSMQYKIITAPQRLNARPPEMG
jgi:biotin operon repressor